MKYITKQILLFASLLFAFGCQQKAFDSNCTNNTRYIHDSVNKTTEIIVHDIFSPVVAARIYAYSNIALYETLRQVHTDYKTLAGQLNGLEPIPAPPADTKIDINLAALHAYMTVSKAMIFSEHEMEDYRNAMYAEFKEKGFPEDLFNNSLEYGKTVADHIIGWSKKDNYAQSRSAPKYTVNTEAGRWVPTPPAFIEGVEPNWRTIRPMLMDSASQYAPLRPTPFSADKESEFYKQAMDVYKAIETDRDNKVAIASFWDCNPYVMHQQGHLMYASKKITPGGHWMGIVGLTTRKVNADMMKTAEAYALVSIGLFDGFISCWDEKYRSNLCRPETFINQNIDPSWTPLLQTPPFPEYTSGHSVISTASSVILTDLFGDNFAFADSTEVPYGMPVRSFNSFKEAAAEAAISRYYGGIHYMPAIDNGVTQGAKIGEMVLAKVSTKG